MEKPYICVWADDTWCIPEDLEEYLTFMSDDYEHVYAGTYRYHYLTETMP